MVTEEVKRSLLNHARVDAVVLVEPNRPKRALMNIEPRADMPNFNLMGLPGIEWVIGEIIGREKLVDSGLSAL